LTKLEYKNLANGYHPTNYSFYTLSARINFVCYVSSIIINNQWYVLWLWL